MLKHYNLLDQSKHAVDMFYDTLGLQNEPEKRHAKYLLPRQAMGVALSKVVGDSIAAHALEKERTTIIHYRRKHDINMAWAEGYDTLFETATYIVDTYMNEAAKVDRIRYIDNAIKLLINEKEKIQSTTNV